MTAVSLFHSVGWILLSRIFWKINGVLLADVYRARIKKQVSVKRGLMVTFSEHAIHSTWTALINLNSRSLNNHWPSHRGALIITCDVTTDGICPSKNSLFPIVTGRTRQRTYVITRNIFLKYFTRNHFGTSKI